MLRFLSGKTPRIFTSVAIVDGFGGPGLRTVEEVWVKMRNYSEAEIERYLSRNESLDKAGAYSIQGQGRALIEALDGDYLAAFGLPWKRLADYFRGGFRASAERLAVAGLLFLAGASKPLALLPAAGPPAPRPVRTGHAYCRVDRSSCCRGTSPGAAAGNL
jgi:hypothetical protein